MILSPFAYNEKYWPEKYKLSSLSLGVRATVNSLRLFAKSVLL